MNDKRPSSLGWPEPVVGAASAGLGWPDGIVQRPSTSVSPTSTSGETPSSAGPAAGWDSSGTGPGSDAAPGVAPPSGMPAAPDPPPSPSAADPADEPPPVADVSRETSDAAASWTGGTLTAAEVGSGTSDHPHDDGHPLARATEHALAVHERRPVRTHLPRPPSTRILVTANQKGGVGKTTTAVNVAAALAQHGQRVVLLDLDPQGNASTALAVEHAEGTPGTYDVLVHDAALADVLAESPDVPGLLVCPATIDLAGAEIELVSMVARETRLKRALDAYLRGLTGEERVDYVIIDCPPSLGLLTVNALSAGSEMLIPIQCEYYALEGLGALLRTIEQITTHLNPDLTIGAILLTMFDGRTRLAAGVADEVRQHFGDRVLRTNIPRSVRISEAPSYGQTVMTYDPGSTGALSYLQAAQELNEGASS